MARVSILLVAAAFFITVVPITGMVGYVCPFQNLQIKHRLGGSAVARKATEMPANMASIPVPLALLKRVNCGTLPTWKALTLK
jgi:hypothetical protein